MAVVSYLNMNRMYVINTILFLFIIGGIILWLHMMVQTTYGTNDALCANPLTKYFNKKAAERCYLNQVNKDSTWMHKNLDKIMDSIGARQDKVGSDVHELLQKYTAKVENENADKAAKLIQTQTAADDLQNTVNDIKTAYGENQSMIMSLYQTYENNLEEHATKMKMVAAKIKERLQRTVHNPKMADVRKKMVQAYKKIGANIKKIGNSVIGKKSISKLSKSLAVGKKKK